VLNRLKLTRRHNGFGIEHQNAPEEYNRSLDLEFKVHGFYHLTLQVNQILFAFGIVSVFLVEMDNHLFERGRKWLVHLGGQQKTAGAELNEVELFNGDFFVYETR